MLFNFSFLCSISIEYSVKTNDDTIWNNALISHNFCKVLIWNGKFKNIFCDVNCDLAKKKNSLSKNMPSPKNFESKTTFRN